MQLISPFQRLGHEGRLSPRESGRFHKLGWPTARSALRKCSALNFSSLSAKTDPSVSRDAEKKKRSLIPSTACFWEVMPQARGQLASFTVCTISKVSENSICATVLCCNTNFQKRTRSAALLFPERIAAANKLHRRIETALLLEILISFQLASLSDATKFA